MAGVPLNPRPLGGPGGRGPPGSGAGDDQPPQRRAAANAAGKSGGSGVSSVATGKSTSGTSNSTSRRFTQTSFSATSSSSSAARGPAPRGPVGGKPRAGLEDWPSIPSRAGSSAPKLDLARSYDPSPEVIRTGSWPYNYVSGGAAPARPARVGGQRPGLGNLSNSAARADARGPAGTGAGASGGDKYFGSARSTLGARANQTSFAKSDAYATDYASGATTRYTTVSGAATSTSATSATSATLRVIEI